MQFPFVKERMIDIYVVGRVARQVETVPRGLDDFALARDIETQ